MTSSMTYYSAILVWNAISQMEMKNFASLQVSAESGTNQLLEANNWNKLPLSL